MDLHDSRAFTRRVFLHRGLTLASTAVTVPHFLQGAALAAARPAGAMGSRPGVPDDRILVVVQLAGGNDGLNTVVPFGDAEYYRARPGIGVRESDVLKLGSSGFESGLGLHPNLAPVKELYDRGVMSIVQGVGYPNPNRSHFKSMDIWHTADTGGRGDGWLGRYFDNECAGQPGGGGGAGGAGGHEAVSIGRSAPLALQGRKSRPISFETPDLFKWTGLESDELGGLGQPADELVSETYRHLMTQPPKGEGEHTTASFLVRTAMDAQIASDRIRKAVERQPLVNYPGTRIGRDLAMVAQMIRSGLETRVYYVTLGGFDTHARQGGAGGRHANLLNQFARAVAAFYDDLAKQGNEGRVLTMSFSEFGRRVAQNGSGGTDHGAAAPMFLFGPMVKPGVSGKHPSLVDLDSGDLKYTVDFRSVYSGLLQDWMKTEAKDVLGQKFRAARLLNV